MTIIQPTKSEIAELLAPQSGGLFDLLKDSRMPFMKRVWIGKVKECPLPDRRNYDGKCYEKMSVNGVQCLGVHGQVIQHAYDNVFVQMQGI